MIFDDHDVHRRLEHLVAVAEGRPRGSRGGTPRITGAFMAYWVYQHLGNLAPPELEEEPMYRTAIAAGRRRRPAARGVRRSTADRESAATRWACRRDFGRSRVLVVDSRAARVLDDDHRDMVDEEEWAWIVERSREALDHLVIVSTAAGVHVAGRALPRGVERGGVRRRLGPAGRVGSASASGARSTSSTGRRSRRRSRPMVDLLRDVAGGARGGRPPASVTLVGGDIHNAYVAEVSLGRRDERPQPRAPARLLAVPKPALPGASGGSSA